MIVDSAAKESAFGEFAVDEPIGNIATIVVPIRKSRSSVGVMIVEYSSTDR